MTLYTLFVTVHSVLRWVVLIAGLAAAGMALAGWLGKRPWTRLDDRLGLIYTISMDLQLLVGLILYIFLSPLTQAAFQNLGGAMRDTVLRFFAIEHIFTMVIAVVLAHVGRAMSRRAAEAKKHQRAALWYTVSVLALLAGIPWPFMSAGRPLNPFHLFGG
jgi:hypothetical protein